MCKNPSSFSFLFYAGRVGFRCSDLSNLQAYVGLWHAFTRMRVDHNIKFSKTGTTRNKRESPRAPVTPSDIPYGLITHG